MIIIREKQKNLDDLLTFFTKNSLYVASHKAILKHALLFIAEVFPDEVTTFSFPLELRKKMRVHIKNSK